MAPRSSPRWTAPPECWTLQANLARLTAATGQPATQQPDGTYRLDVRDGSWSEFDAAGRLLQYTPSETRLSTNADGTTTWIESDDTVRTVDVHGTPGVAGLPRRRGSHATG